MYGYKQYQIHVQILFQEQQSVSDRILVLPSNLPPDISWKLRNVISNNVKAKRVLVKKVLNAS